MPIFDQGYQHWNGRLSGHAWRWLAISRRGIRAALQAKGVRLLILLAWAPALALAGVLSLWGLVEQKSVYVLPYLANMRLFNNIALQDPVSFRADIWSICFFYFMEIELWFTIIVIMRIGPDLISQDLRFNALPLYFSRPLRRVDYFLGKLGVIGAFIGMTTIIPCLIAYVMGGLFSFDVSVIRDTFPILLRALVAGVVVIGSAGMLVLAMSSLSRNSRYIAIAWIGFCLCGGVVSSILIQIDQDQLRRAAYMEFQQKQMQGEAPTGLDPQAIARWIAMQQQQSMANDPLSLYVEKQREAAPRDWRSLFSYRANLSRIDDALLGTTDHIGHIMNSLTPQLRMSIDRAPVSARYPWTWSLGVLAGLFLLSIVALHFSVRSLDRLK